MDLELKGKKALVTGASRGLGYATARQLALEGAEVVINSRSAEKLNPAAEKLRVESGQPIHGLTGDLADPTAINVLVQKAVEIMGGLDILVTNAGGPPPGSFESFDETTWANAIDLSFLSHVRLIRAALPHLRKSSVGSVLTVTSYSVKQPVPNLILSNSIRSATIGLTKTLALELGAEGIRFNSILPGFTETERIIELMSFRAEENQTTIEEEIEKQMVNCPLGRMASPEEFAKAAAFLVSPAASYITGVMLTVDGGVYKGTM